MQRRTLYLISLLVIIVVGAPVFAETADDFLKAYFQVQDADAAEKSGDAQKAAEKYSAALRLLRDIKRTAPDWNPNIIAYRSKYCAEHILKNGGKIPEEGSPAPAPAPTPAPQIAAPVTPTAPEVATAPESTPAPSEIAPTSGTARIETPISASGTGTTEERVARLEQELSQARADLRKVQDEKNNLEARLRKAEDDLKIANFSGDDRVQALLKENNSLKDKLADAENRLRNMPSSSDEIGSIKAELAKTQAQLESVQKENDQLRAANDALKKDLEDTRTQLKTASAGGASSMSSEELQALQKENALLRSIVDRQFQEDAKRTAARDALAGELKELASRTQSIRSQIEILQTPLSPLSDEERDLLKTPATSIRTAGDDNKLSGTVTAQHAPSSSSSSSSSSTTSSTSASGESGKLSGNNAMLASDGKMLFAKGDMEGAASKFEQILQTDPDNLYALSNLGVIRFRQDRIDQAERALQRALSVDPHDAFSLSVLGIVHYRQGKFDDSISDLTRAIALNPNNHETHNYLGITYSQKGYQEAAEKELLKAIELKPTYADAHFNLAVVYASETPASIEMAKKHYKKAIELGMSADPELEKLLQK